MRPVYPEFPPNSRRASTLRTGPRLPNPCETLSGLFTSDCIVPCRTLPLGGQSPPPPAELFRQTPSSAGTSDSPRYSMLASGRQRGFPGGNDPFALARGGVVLQPPSQLLAPLGRKLRTLSLTPPPPSTCCGCPLVIANIATLLSAPDSEPCSSLEALDRLKESQSPRHRNLASPPPPHLAPKHLTPHHQPKHD